MKISTILHNPNAADESYEVEDLLDFDAKIEDLKLITDHSSKRSLIGIIGGYGTGKSVMLNKYRNKYAGNRSKAIWIHFDAWKYPDRKDLWEGFVLDFIHQYDPDLFEPFRKIMDGESTRVAKVVTAAAKLMPLVGVATSDTIKAFTESSQAKRVYEIQALFAELFHQEMPKGRIYIEIEDADRSGEAGIFFIETLSHFMKIFPVDIEIKIFVPISLRSYRKDEQHDAYIKALDFISYYKVTDRDLKKFAASIFNKDIIADRLYENHMREWTQRLLHVYQKSLREIKFIIRNAEVMFQQMLKDGDYPDPLIVYIMASLKELPGMSDDQSMFDNVVLNKRIEQQNHSQPWLLLVAQAAKQETGGMSDIIGIGNIPLYSSNIAITNGDTDSLSFTYEPQKDTDTIIAKEFSNHYYLPVFYVNK